MLNNEKEKQQQQINKRVEETKRTSENVKLLFKKKEGGNK